MSGLSRRQTEIGNEFGFHLRAASRFVQLSQRFQSDVRVFCDGRTANGKSILDLITLGAGRGSLLEIEINGPDAEEATAQLLRTYRGGVTRGRGRSERVLMPMSYDTRRALPGSSPFVGCREFEPCRGQALLSVVENSRIRWVILMSCLSLLDSAKARSTRRTRLFRLSGWLKPKAGASSRSVAEDRRRASQAATSLPNCPLRRT